jgi:hypothetical protein
MDSTRTPEAQTFWRRTLVAIPTLGNAARTEMAAMRGGGFSDAEIWIAAG